MRTFSKSKLLALRQCPKRLWLEIHRPDLREDSAATEASFQAGDQVGEIARQIYDPHKLGALIDVNADGFTRALERSSELLKLDQPIFEAGFSAGGALAFADVMLPEQIGGQQVWHMVEVKSSTSVKDYHRDDVAVQAYVAQSAGVALQSIALAHIDSSWTYPGNGDYSGLLKENDLTEEAFSRTEEVKAWVAQAQQTAALPAEPDIETGLHCDTPYACGFYDYCTRNQPKAQYPIHWLPRFGAAAQAFAGHGVFELREVPDDLLNPLQLRVKTPHLSGQ
jgi:hypothetical protein